MLGLTSVCIAGPSMEPTLRSGDWWLVRTFGRLRPGDVALLHHPMRPDLLIVKRIMRREPGGFWVEGGRIAFPVQEITIAGNMRTMFKGISAVGADVYEYGAKSVGSILVNRMKVAGS